MNKDLYLRTRKLARKSDVQLSPKGEGERRREKEHIESEKMGKRKKCQDGWI